MTYWRFRKKEWLEYRDEKGINDMEFAVASHRRVVNKGVRRSGSGFVLKVEPTGSTDSLLGRT